ncbi:MAG: UPF0175 family protein [Anaerolineales bacterium]|nr:UPF0175 family protein [Anaerolineales bacterium]
MADSAVIEIPVHLLQAARTTPDELRIELAVQLYRQRRLSFGHARELAGINLWEFRQLLSTRRISPHYDSADLDADMQTWTKLDSR